MVFPWDLTRSFELALLKTFCGPSISALLDRTGEFAQRPRKRFHGHYTIGNDDFRYVLSPFVAEPIHWLSRYGWRGPPTWSRSTCSASGRRWGSG